MNVSLNAFKFCSLSFLLLIIISTFNPEQRPVYADEKSKFESATTLINRGLFPEAVGVYQEILINSLDADVRARALFFSGSVYDFYLDQPEMALQCFNEVVTLYPESTPAADALFNSARILYKKDNYEKACTLFNQYISKYPESMRCKSATAWIDNAQKKMVHGKPPKKTIKKTALDLNSYIRVLIKKNADRLVFNAPGKIQITHPETKDVLFNEKGPVVLSINKGVLALNNIKAQVTRCNIASNSTFMSIGGQRFRGRFSISSDSSGLSAVNQLHVEHYLYGVVPKEMSWLWSEQALMAQAIASRTYALYIRDKQPGSRLYDLESTTDSQVYGGLDAEKKQTSKAVDNTRGKVMTYHKKLIIAYFHANSGGHTESSLNVWGVDLPYLQSIFDSVNTPSNDNAWEYYLSYKGLRKVFKKSMPSMGQIKKLKLEEKSESGRIKSFLLVTDKGDVRLTGNNFRRIIGPTLMKSTLFKIHPEKKGIFFKGSGYGHGVGMSQWGAHLMAKAGYSCKAILSHYYQGIKIETTSYIALTQNSPEG